MARGNLRETNGCIRGHAGGLLFHTPQGKQGTRPSPANPRYMDLSIFISFKSVRSAHYARPRHAGSTTWEGD